MKELEIMQLKFKHCGVIQESIVIKQDFYHNAFYVQCESCGKYIYLSVEVRDYKIKPETF